MMTAPAFTVVVPVYNVASYIAEALNSVCAQTFSNWECVCVDDGSTDESGMILDEYARRDSRFRVVHQDNQGVAVARNAALEIARGRWLVFLDGDDMWHPQLLQTCAECFQRHPECHAVRFDNQLTDNPEKLLANVGRISNVQEKKLLRNVWTSENSYTTFFSYAYDMDRIRDIRFMKLKVGEDSAWAIDCLERVNCIVRLVGPVLYAYRLRQGSAMNSALTAEKLYDEVVWQFHRALCVANSSRPADDEYRLNLTKSVTLSMSKQFFQLKRPERREAWNAWLAGMRMLLKTKLLTGWCRIAAKVCCLSKLQLSFAVLFRFPLWVKQQFV